MVWADLASRGLEIFERVSVEYDWVNLETCFREVWADVVELPWRYAYDDSTGHFRRIEEWMKVHKEEVINRYDPEVLGWLREWQMNLYYVLDPWTSDDLPRPTKGLEPSRELVLVYLALRGPIPSDFPDGCSFGSVIESIEGLVKTYEKEQRDRRIRQFLRQHPEFKAAVNSGQVPSSYGKELSLLELSVNEVVKYYKTYSLVPSRCGKAARKLLRDYVATYGSLPESPEMCLWKLGKASYAGVEQYMDRLLGSMRRELLTRKSRQYLRESSEVPQEHLLEA